MDAQWSLETRRSYPRVEVSLAVRIEAVGHQDPINGVTVNLARGGALIRMDHEITVGDRYLIHFVERAGRFGDELTACRRCGYVAPLHAVPRQALWARALRQGRGAMHFAAAFEFETLLELVPDAA